ncbi:MAG: hypothetical protein ACLRM6_00600 [Christensenellales bacterium]
MKFIGLEQHFFQGKYPLFKLANATRQRCLPRFLSAGRTTGVSFIFSTTLNTDALISIVITTLIVIQAVYHHFHSTIHHLFHFVIRLAMDVFYHGNERSSTVWRQILRNFSFWVANGDFCGIMNVFSSVF